MWVHKGPAKVYIDEEAACTDLNAGKIEPGQVVVVRYVGPKGDPGMLLLQRFLWQLAAKGMHDKVAFLTDGRFSGTNKGRGVAHISPEAIAGGPLAVVQDGDLIEIEHPPKITLICDLRRGNASAAGGLGTSRKTGPQGVSLHL